MAFNRVPVSAQDLIKVNPNAKSLVAMYNYINKKYKIIDPFSFDNSKPNHVKVVRELQYEINLRDWNKKNEFTMVFGNGSRGNRGVNNRGSIYEGELYNALNLYIEEGLDACKHSSFYNEVVKINALVPNMFYPEKVISTGSLNQKRKTTISNAGIKKQAGDVNIGSKISDVTLVCRNKVGVKRNMYIHLSLKHGKTVSFINLGIRKWLIEDEIKNKKIENRTGRDLLELLGINEEKFCNVFNNYNPQTPKGEKTYDNVTDKLKNSIYFKEFLKSIIGYGYIIVHKTKNGTEVFEMTKSKMESFIKIQNVVVEYPQNGSAKRIDVIVTLNGIKINLNIRSTSGTVYPTHILAHYSYI